tara:strand:+ start:1512 stop:1634 length:123 start_codon:yes stop_codon:yes gene_type:complete
MPSFNFSEKYFDGFKKLSKSKKHPLFNKLEFVIIENKNFA